ncbi:hypothetical protein ZYGR_0Z00140 [Zygosaccharomyces rouxii]|uniref:ZYRO0G00374p n=2 Tax=Zygosaccharomyces rouxii TaxID=4956 RepID=C5E1Q0_ZYGRC|nr:uncharacterized protein ZYRO0G00374g [Zygosaccharomyces rouxii]KAH9202091.1 fungal-specific transcription factor domain-containing protein [Zygosaccharomyces rouxii]GAV50591.1 hypothetical protein ZYGR_0Z00140 [Zygosaccharomyces rouxii]CAR29093.1 ZYRO0G00374p [Zygosaccharomyces rouxii]
MLMIRRMIKVPKSLTTLAYLSKLDDNYGGERREMTKYTRSRNGCRKCKELKIKCDEQRPRCQNCIRRNFQPCDYSKVLQWGGRPGKKNNQQQLQGLVCKPTPKPSPLPTFQPDTLLQDLFVQNHQSIPSNCFDIENNNNENSDEYNDRLPLISTGDTSLHSLRTPWSASVAFSKIPLSSLQLPSPLPDVLLNTPHYLNLFEFYMRETAYLLVPLPRELYSDNPFCWRFGQMALACPTLLYLLLAFSANHRTMIATQKRKLELPSLEEPWNLESSSESSLAPFGDVETGNTLTNELLTITFNNLLVDLTNEQRRKSDCTLATIMMLAAFDIFFSDRRRKWRAHVNGAGRLIMERLCGSDCNMLTLQDSEEQTDLFFLTRWFSYLDIIGSLSSTSRVITTEKLQAIKYKSMLTDPSVLKSRRINLSDLEAGTGFEYTILSYLAEVSSLIKEKESEQDETGMERMSQEMLAKVLELDYEINTYLENSERERSQIYEKYYSKKPWENYRGYYNLRITNLIFGLTGSYQLKRRVLNLPLDSKIVQDLLVRITKLVDENVPLAASSTSCLSFCLFSCGCELLNDSMAQYRPIYMERIDALNKEGVNCAAMAKSIMEKCWKFKKNWWDILREENLDITFAI